MKLRSIHIIAAILFALFACNEIAADLSLLRSHQETCANCEPGSPQNNLEERSAEQEQKILVTSVQLPLLPCTLQLHTSI